MRVGSLRCGVRSSVSLSFAFVYQVRGRWPARAVDEPVQMGNRAGAIDVWRGGREYAHMSLCGGWRARTSATACWCRSSARGASATPRSSGRACATRSAAARCTPCTVATPQASGTRRAECESMEKAFRVSEDGRAVARRTRPRVVARGIILDYLYVPARLDLFAVESERLAAAKDQALSHPPLALLTRRVRVCEAADEPSLAAPLVGVRIGHGVAEGAASQVAAVHGDKLLAMRAIETPLLGLVVVPYLARGGRRLAAAL
jgi:hypothetical protein